VLVAADQVTEGREYMIEAEGANRADIEIDVIAGAGCDGEAALRSRARRRWCR
jgi:hypothetical protein